MPLRMKSDPAAGNANDEVAAALTTEIPDAAAAGETTMRSEAGALNKAAAAAVSGSTEPAAREEKDMPKLKPKPLPLRVQDRPKATVIAVRTERVDEDFIEYLRTNPRRRPTPLAEEDIKEFPGLAEAVRAAHAKINRAVDLQEDILRQYDEKGYALVRVEHLDNGRRRLFQLPVEETTAL